MKLTTVVEWLEASEPSGEGAVDSNDVGNEVKVGPAGDNDGIGGGGYGNHYFVHFHFDEISEILERLWRWEWLSRGRFSWDDWQKIDFWPCLQY